MLRHIAGIIRACDVDNHGVRHRPNELCQPPHLFRTGLCLYQHIPRLMPQGIAADLKPARPVLGEKILEEGDCPLLKGRREQDRTDRGVAAEQHPAPRFEALVVDAEQCPPVDHDMRLVDDDAAQIAYIVCLTYNLREIIIIDECLRRDEQHPRPPRADRLQDRRGIHPAAVGEDLLICMRRPHDALCRAHLIDGERDGRHNDDRESLPLICEGLRNEALAPARRQGDQGRVTVGRIKCTVDCQFLCG